MYRSLLINSVAVSHLGQSNKRVINLTDRINDIVIYTLGVFRAHAYLDETVVYAQCLPAALWAIFDFLSLGAVKRRPVGMPRSFIDYGFL